MPFGYNQIFTDIPESWETSGLVSIVDGSGTPSFKAQPSGVISGITRSSTGVYVIALSEAWNSLKYCHATPIGADGYAIAVAAHTVGATPTASSSTLPTITLHVLYSASIVDLPSGSSFCFHLILKKMSL
jgi:hypothetical protein